MNKLILPFIKPFFAGLNETVLEILILCCVVLPILILIIRSQNIVARSIKVKSLQLKISLIGAVPLFSALILIILFFQDAVVKYENTQQLKEMLPVREQIDFAIRDIESIRDTDYLTRDYTEHFFVNVHMSTLKDHDEILQKLAPFDFTKQQRYESEITLSADLVKNNLENKLDRTNVPQRFINYTNAVKSMNNLRHELE